MNWLIITFLGVLGAMMGSFACCQAWRLHARAENKKLGKRSECMECGYELKWYDNLPIISWVALRGKCRKCGKKIGISEIVAEVTLAVVFVLIGMRMLGFLDLGMEVESWFGLGYTVQDLDILPVVDAITIARLVILLILMTCFWVLAVYDAKWGELPVGLMVATNLIALAYAVVTVAGNGWQMDPLMILGSVGLLAGIYYLLYFFSKEKWVGGGDWILCLAISLILMDWRLAIVELFVANLLALLASAPMAIKKKQKQVPFGPFLIAGLTIIVIFVK